MWEADSDDLRKSCASNAVVLMFMQAYIGVPAFCTSTTSQGVNRSRSLVVWCIESTATTVPSLSLSNAAGFCGLGEDGGHRVDAAETVMPGLSVFEAHCELSVHIWQHIIFLFVLMQRRPELITQIHRP